tara:strand:- start:388 stop:519 length:132 start_codon:yes stop_codon:yes gene_type:complete
VEIASQAEWGKRKKREKKEGKQVRERDWGDLVALLITFLFYQL